MGKSQAGSANEACTGNEDTGLRPGRAEEKESVAARSGTREKRSCGFRVGVQSEARARVAGCKVRKSRPRPKIA